MEMPFGKYEGKELSDIPHDYLDWLVGSLEDDMAEKQKLMDAIEDRLKMKEVT